MCTLHLTATDMNWRSDDFINTQLVYQHTDTCNIRYGVHLSNFAKMYLFNFTAMCVAFSLRNQMIHRQYICAYLFGNIKMFYDMFDFVHTGMVMVVMMVVVMVVHMLVLMFTIYAYIYMRSRYATLYTCRLTYGYIRNTKFI